MRKLLTVLGLVTLMAAPALATSPKEYTTESHLAGPSTRVRLDRSVFDQLGPRVDVKSMCGQKGAASIDEKRTAGDVLLTFLSVGFYTPTHAKVQCNRPGGAPIGMR